VLNCASIFQLYGTSYLSVKKTLTGLFENVTFLSGHLQFAFEAVGFLFLSALMTAAGKSFGP
jgi:hypothetical protein